jgi:aspartate 1-decarboxylase
LFLYILKSKIHRATVTGANIHYEGSITIDGELIEHAKILPYEKVLVVDIENGERLETYVIKGKYGSGEICLNGAAARKVTAGDKVIIMSFTLIDENKAEAFKPRIVFVDERNRITGEMDHVEKNDEC